jgi:hypothetical protein
MFFYDNIREWVRKETESLYENERLEWLYLLREAVDELIDDMKNNEERT